MRPSSLRAVLFGLCFLQLVPCALAQTKLAFVAGVEKYDKSGLKNLDFAEEDAKEVKSALEKLGFRVESAIGDDASLVKLNASLERFMTQTKKLNKSDIVIVYFSGHGVQKLVERPNAAGKLIEVEEPFFCPRDALKSDVSTLLPLNSLLKNLEESSGSDHNIILLDACRDSADKNGKGGIDGSTIRELSDKLALFFAAKSGQRSFEHGDLKHGIFTYFLLEGLRGAAADTDGEVTFQGLANHVSKQVERRSPELLDIPTLNAQRPNLMGNLTGTMVLGRVERRIPAPSSTSDAKTFTNDLGMRFVRVEPGEFMMGNEDSVDELIKMFPSTKKEQFENESPRHLVKITRPYYLGIHEVTVGQFRSFVEATSYKTEAETDGKGGWGFDDKVRGPDQSWSYNWRNPGYRQSETHPVTNVSWNDAQRFIEWLSKKEGRTYRLPTEAEWEYACRAGTRTRHWHGGNPEGLADVANVQDKTATATYKWKDSIVPSDGFVHASPVGSFRANPWGLHDMHGNVWEWCSDWYAEYPNGLVTNPTGPSEGLRRVLRGGGWHDAVVTCRSAERSYDITDFRSFVLGFRVALVPVTVAELQSSAGAGGQE